MIFAFLLCAIPTIVNVYLDRNGRQKKHKPFIKAFIILLAGGVALADRVLFDIDATQSLALASGYYILAFDYLIVYYLRKNDVITPTAKVFSYTGTSTYWYDQLVARIPWRLRLAIRLVVFLGSIVIFAI